MAAFNKLGNINPNTKKFIYFAAEILGNKHQTLHEEKNAANDLLDKMLKAIGREVLREKTPTVQDLERSLQDISAQQQHEQRDSIGNKETRGQETDIKGNGIPVSGTPIVAQLMQKGYLKDSNKWLTSKGFINIGW